MKEQTIKSLERRIKALEREAVRLRKGTVTDTDPLSIDLGDSGVAYENIHTVGPVVEDDTVAVLTRDSGMLALGKICAPSLPRCRVARSVGQEIGNVSWTAVSWTDESYDTANLYSPSNPDRILIPDTGLWIVTAQVEMAPGASGVYRGLRIVNNGGAILAQDDTSPSAFATRMNCTAHVVHSNDAGFVRAQVWHDAGSTLNFLTGWFAAARIA